MKRLRGTVALIAVLVMPCVARAQAPTVGAIDFYGLRTLAPAHLVRALSLQIGDSLLLSEAEMRERLLHVRGVADAAVAIVCCEAGRLLVYVGIGEVGAQELSFEPASLDARQLADREVDAVEASDSLTVALLVEAMRDIDPYVRQSAMRKLAAAVMQHDTRTQLHIPYAPFIDLLNSLNWTDRSRAAIALTALTVDRDPGLLQEVRQRGFDSLVDMVRWRAFGHAAPAAVILGRIANLPEADIMPTFRKNREGIIVAARDAVPAPGARP